MIQVKKAEHVGAMKVRVTFNDGTEGVVDLRGEVGEGKTPAQVRAMFANLTLDGHSVFFESEPNSHFAASWYYAKAHKLGTPKTLEDVEANERAVSLRRLRELAGMTQVAAAKAAGIEQPEVARIEKQGDMKVSTLTKYLGGLGFGLKLVAGKPGLTVPVNLAPGPKEAKPRPAGKSPLPKKRPAGA